LISQDLLVFGFSQSLFDLFLINPLLTQFASPASVCCAAETWSGFRPSPGRIARRPKNRYLLIVEPSHLPRTAQNPDRSIFAGSLLQSGSGIQKSQRFQISDFRGFLLLQAVDILFTQVLPNPQPGGDNSGQSKRVFTIQKTLIRFGFFFCALSAVISLSIEKANSRRTAQACPRLLLIDFPTGSACAGTTQAATAIQNCANQSDKTMRTFSPKPASPSQSPFQKASLRFLLTRTRLTPEIIVFAYDYRSPPIFSTRKSVPFPRRKAKIYDHGQCQPKRGRTDINRSYRYYT
jgi:hypothetical protein